MSFKAQKLIWMLEDILEKEKELQEGIRVWEEGEDQCSMAACDPSDQFLIGEEIERMWREFKDEVNRDE